MNDCSVEADTKTVDEIFFIANCCVGKRGWRMQSDIYLLIKIFVSVEFPGEVVAASTFEEGDWKLGVGIFVDEEIESAIATNEPDVGEVVQG